MRSWEMSRKYVWMYRMSDICCYKMYIFCLENNHQTSVCLLIHKYRIYRRVNTYSISRQCLGNSPSSYQPPAFVYYRLAEWHPQEWVNEWFTIIAVMGEMMVMPRCIQDRTVNSFYCYALLSPFSLTYKNIG